MGQETVICRLGWVRIFQMPGSRLRIRAAPSNCSSMSSKIDPLAAMSLLNESGPRYFGPLHLVNTRRRCHNDRYMKTATDAPVLQKRQEHAASFTTISGRPIERLYTPDDISGLTYARDLADPGAF